MISKFSFLCTKWSLQSRIAFVALLFIADKVFLGLFVDFDRAQAAQGLGAIVRGVQHWGFRFLVALAAALALFAYTRDEDRLRSATSVMRIVRVRGGWLLAHLILIGCLVAPSYWLYRPESSLLPFGVTVFLLVFLGAAAAACAILAMALGNVGLVWRAPWASYGLMRR